MRWQGTRTHVAHSKTAQLAHGNGNAKTVGCGTRPNGSLKGNKKSAPHEHRARTASRPDRTRGRFENHRRFLVAFPNRAEWICAGPKKRNMHPTFPAKTAARKRTQPFNEHEPAAPQQTPTRQSTQARYRTFLDTTRWKRRDAHMMHVLHMQRVTAPTHLPRDVQAFLRATIETAQRIPLLANAHTAHTQPTRAHKQQTVDRNPLTAKRTGVSPKTQLNL